MNTPPIRVRFAPAPTGMMHLGNIRSALMNYLFAQQMKGTFVLRIEDTDADRNFDPKATQIIHDLDWLNLTFDEGPHKGGPYAPYFQSQRTAIYQEYLLKLIEMKKAYRCFCSEEELERKRERQMALRMPPRYDRTCLTYSADEISARLAALTPFIWRFKLDHDRNVAITDLARKKVIFEMRNFSDFPLTRQDGSVTFVFANFVDDATMHISHVFRGEEHLSNTAVQSALYEAFDLPMPIFWHMPLLCSIEGKKLSKRDFGFSLRDLKEAGFLPQAICNYLAIIGTSFEEEILTLEQLSAQFSFTTIHSAGHIKYDPEKLKWVNRQWIMKLSADELVSACLPFLQTSYPQIGTFSQEALARALMIVRTEMVTLKDSVTLLSFLFNAPTLTSLDLAACLPDAHLHTMQTLASSHEHLLSNPLNFTTAVKESAKKHILPLKHVFWFFRLCLMGAANGPSIQELIEILGNDEAVQRIKSGLNVLRTSL